MNVECTLKKRILNKKLYNLKNYYIIIIIIKKNTK